MQGKRPKLSLSQCWAEGMCTPRDCEGAQLHIGRGHVITTAEHIFLYTWNEFARKEVFGFFYLFFFFFQPSKQLGQ